MTCTVLSPHAYAHAFLNRPVALTTPHPLHQTLHRLCAHQPHLSGPGRGVLRSTQGRRLQPLCSGRLSSDAASCHSDSVLVVCVFFGYLHRVLLCCSIVVMGAGRVVEMGSPADLLARPGSAFGAMVDETGPAAAVLRAAAVKHQSGQGYGDAGSEHTRFPSASPLFPPPPPNTHTHSHPHHLSPPPSYSPSHTRHMFRLPLPTLPSHKPSHNDPVPLH